MPPAGGWEAESLRVRPDNLEAMGLSVMQSNATCMLSYYYLIEECSYVTVVEAIEQNESFGVHFNMADTVSWHTPCDTLACLTLDGIQLVLYDVLAPPADQSMNLKVFGADDDGEPIGELLGNLDFEPAYVDTATFTSLEIDFTDGGMEPGLDLSGCVGNFVVLLTWKNDTGHPCFVLDNISTCVDSCPAEPACCQMGTFPYVYPRLGTRTYYYGLEWEWSKQDSFCDIGGCVPYGYLEALWECGFCTSSPATEPISWGGIKAMYR
jgi:hypothetical protein